MKISKRLQSIASFVDDEAKVLDVGCDHALLDIFLVRNKKNVEVIATDINPRPLEMAKKNLATYELTDKIELKLGNGLEHITPNIDTVVISGLGGKTIVDLLNKAVTKLTNVNSLIISPHNDIYDVRKFMMSIDYAIEDELLLFDKNKPYTIIKFVKRRAEYSDEELFFGPKILARKDANFYDYYQSLLIKNKNIINKLPKNKKDIKLKLKNEIERLDDVLKV